MTNTMRGLGGLDIGGLLAALALVACAEGEPVDPMSGRDASDVAGTGDASRGSGPDGATDGSGAAAPAGSGGESSTGGATSSDDDGGPGGAPGEGGAVSAGGGGEGGDDAAGGELSAATLVSQCARVHAAAGDDEGNVYVAGTYAGSEDQPCDLGAGEPRYDQGLFVLALDRAGSYVWSQQFSSAHPESVTDIAVDAEGSVVIAGTATHSLYFEEGHVSLDDVETFLLRFDPGGEVRWGRGYAGGVIQSVAMTPSGDILVSGPCSSFETMDLGGGTLGDVDDASTFMGKLDAEGAHLWSNDHLFREARLAAAADGATVAVAQVIGPWGLSPGLDVPSGASGIAVARFDDAGTVSTARFILAPAASAGFVAVDPADDATVIGGTFQGSIDFGGGPLQSPAEDSDAFVAKLDDAFSHVWSTSFGGMGPQTMGGMAIGPDGEVVVAGNFDHSIDIDGPIDTGVTGSLYVAALSAQGALEWRRGIARGSVDGVVADATGTTVLGWTSVGMALGDPQIDWGTYFLRFGL